MYQGAKSSIPSLTHIKMMSPLIGMVMVFTLLYKNIFPISNKSSTSMLCSKSAVPGSAAQPQGHLAYCLKSPRFPA